MQRTEIMVVCTCKVVLRGKDCAPCVKSLLLVSILDSSNFPIMG